MQKWQIENSKITTNATKVNLERNQIEYKLLLYSTNKNNNEEIITHIQYDINDNIPEEEGIIKALKKLKNRKLPGLSEISVDEQWYKIARLFSRQKNDDKVKKIMGENY